MSGDELIEQLTEGSNESMSSVLAVLSAMDKVTEQALKAGRIVQLPNGTHFKPTGKKDGSVNIDARVNPDLKKRVNAEFRGKWRNAENCQFSGECLPAVFGQCLPGVFTQSLPL